MVEMIGVLAIIAIAVLNVFFQTDWLISVAEGRVDEEAAVEVTAA